MRKWYVLAIGFFSFGVISYAQGLKIGLIADCQYCDCDYSERWENNYRHGLPRLKQAVDTFNNIPTTLTFHLGDFVDRDIHSFEAVNPIFNSLHMPHYHMLGNHDFNVADSNKSKIPQLLLLEKAYYTVKKNDWAFIILDGTDVSMYRNSNPNYLAHSDSIRKAYLNLGRTQSLPWNGAIGDTQMIWLEEQLQGADNSGMNVIVMCHFPVLPKGDANLWNDVEVVELLEKHASVKAFINGHHHPGNYELHNGIHYLTIKGMVRTTKSNAFANMELFKNKIIVHGYGREPNRTLNF